MKILSTLIITLILSAANAQNSKTVHYEVNTHQEIQSLRLSVSSGFEQSVSPYSIGDFHDMTVCLNLDPSLDYELMVNNTEVIQISSREIRESMKSTEENSPISLVSMQSWIISEE
ncbi:hypothetical protein N9355_08535 [Crocinitomicaceae bacterium]|nr:hypothetical protein [Crocinitomicaceae bacterium]